MTKTFCKKCGDELPDDCNKKLCNDCRKKRNSTIKKVVGIVLFVGVFAVIIEKCSTSETDDDAGDFMYNIDDECFDTPSNLNEEYYGQNSEQEKPQKFIGSINVTGSRLKANEKQFLEEFSERYAEISGKEKTEESKSTGWSSDGKYTRYTHTKHSFEDDKIAITISSSYEDDDGQTGGDKTSLENGRDIINYVRENRNSEMFDDIRDVVDIL